MKARLAKKKRIRWKSLWLDEGFMGSLREVTVKDEWKGGAI